VIVSMQGIVKDFPGTRALDNVDFDLRKGEVHALVGENGAGKSTLAKILAGVYKPDRGTITIDGKRTAIHNPRTAQELGISMVFQELNLVPCLTIAQNLFLAHEPVKLSGWVDRARLRTEAQKALSSIGLDINVQMRLRELSLAQQQMVAVARALSFNPRILILDEPTSALTKREINQLFTILSGLKTRGVGILYISHRLEEVFQIADRVTVLRDGSLVSTADADAVDIEALVTMMVGRTISEMYPKEVASIGAELLRVTGLSKAGVCSNVNLVVHEGEIVGLYGLVGSGRTEMVRLIFGLDARDSGEVLIFGHAIDKPSPPDLVMKGVGFVPEDRKEEGLCLALPVRENIVRASLQKLFPRGFVSPRKETTIAKQLVDALNIVTPSMDTAVVYLSGGNQQKLVLAQWICASSRLLILDEPTRGIDIGAKVEIYRIMNDLVKQGAGILMISSELPEVLGMSDRIYVMREGRIVAEFMRNEADAKKLLSYALGIDEGGGHADPGQ